VLENKYFNSFTATQCTRIFGASCPKTETPSSSVRVQSLEKICEICAAQREQEGVISIPLNELPWVFHKSIMLQNFMVKFYNTNSSRYIKILGVFASILVIQLTARSIENM